MKTDTNAHEIKRANTSNNKERIVGLSWADILLSGRIFSLAALILLVFTLSCSLFGADISPAAKMAQKVATCIEKTDKVQQDIEGVGGDLTQLRTEITNINTTIFQIQQQITKTHNENESLKSLMITFSCIVAGFMVLFFILYLIAAKVSPGSTLWNMLLPWRMVKK